MNGWLCSASLTEIGMLDCADLCCQVTNRFSIFICFSSSVKKSNNQRSHTCGVMCYINNDTIVSIYNCSNTDLCVRKLWSPRVAHHVELPHLHPSGVGWCKHPSEPHQREAAQMENGEEQDFCWSFQVCPALYCAAEEGHYAVMHQAL